MNFVLSLNKKYYFIIVALVFFVLAVAYFYSQPMLAPKAPVKEVKDRQTELAAYLKAETPEQKLAGERNSDYETIDTAVEEKDTAACAQLNNPENLDKCIRTVAIGNNNPKFCQEIKDDSRRKKCLEFLDYAKIILGTEVDECPRLTDPDIRKDCQSAFFWKWDDVADCKIFPDYEKRICRDIILKKQALTKKDPRLCEQIVDTALKGDCQQSIKDKPKDSDGDGLPDSLERSYGSNPFKADTDGDGLSDGDEVIKK